MSANFESLCFPITVVVVKDVVDVVFHLSKDFVAEGKEFLCPTELGGHLAELEVSLFKVGDYGLQFCQCGFVGMVGHKK